MSDKELKEGMPLFELIRDSLIMFPSSQFIFNLDNADNSFELVLWQNGESIVKDRGEYKEGFNLAQRFLSLITDKKKISKDEGAFGVHSDFVLGNKTVYIKAIFFDADVGKTNMRFFVNTCHVVRDKDIIGTSSLDDVKNISSYAR